MNKLVLVWLDPNFPFGLSYLLNWLIFLLLWSWGLKLELFGGSWGVGWVWLGIFSCVEDAVSLYRLVKSNFQGRFCRNFLFWDFNSIRITRVIISVHMHDLSFSIKKLSSKSILFISFFDLCWLLFSRFLPCISNRGRKCKQQRKKARKKDAWR